MLRFKVNRLLAITFLSISLNAWAGVVDIPSGKFVQTEISPDEDELNIKILKLNDTDKTYASSTKIDFYNGDKIGFSLGVLKLDGDQGLTAFYSFGQPSSPTSQSSLKSNLNLNQEYKIYYKYLGKNRINIDAFGAKGSKDIGFKPNKVVHSIIGMKIDVVQIKSRN